MYIDSELFDGSLTYGEMILPGESKEEIFVSTYICHPSMANNECSGPALSAELIRFVSSMKNRKYTYRFIFIPETIGAITYLSKNLDYMKEHVIAGFNLSCVGDERDYSMVESAMRIRWPTRFYKMSWNIVISIQGILFKARVRRKAVQCAGSRTSGGVLLQIKV